MSKETRIPVFYNFDLAANEMVGYATIDETGEMTIRIPTGPLVENLEHLATVDQIVAIAVGVNYRMDRVVRKENDGTR